MDEVDQKQEVDGVSKDYNNFIASSSRDKGTWFNKCINWYVPNMKKIIYMKQKQLITGSDTVEENLGAEHMEVKIPANKNIQFAKKLHPSHVDKRSHGLVLLYFLCTQI